MSGQAGSSAARRGGAQRGGGQRGGRAGAADGPAGRAHQPGPPPGSSPPAATLLIAKMQFSLPSWSWVPGMNPGSFPAHASLGPPPQGYPTEHALMLAYLTGTLDLIDREGPVDDQTGEALEFEFEIEDGFTEIEIG